ncbi:hypothetical protein C8J56DRAFT_888348 [Mycena floridula]|nr:hypothetical protein C8J56DRAFT_888348 [Mycena floridula]
MPDRFYQAIDEVTRRRRKVLEVARWRLVSSIGRFISQYGPNLLIPPTNQIRLSAPGHPNRPTNPAPVRGSARRREIGIRGVGASHVCLCLLLDATWDNGPAETSLVMAVNEEAHVSAPTEHGLLDLGKESTASVDSDAAA